MPDPETGPQPEGTGDFIGQVGLFETANGLPHGPMAIVLGIALALLFYPLRRAVRAVFR